MPPQGYILLWRHPVGCGHATCSQSPRSARSPALPGARKLEIMRVLVISDIHSNLEALTATLADAQRSGGFEFVWALGDLVGYGPDPGACIDRLRQLPLLALAGNHDLAAVDRIGTEEFNSNAAAAVRWTSRQLGPEQSTWLASLPSTTTEAKFSMAHGSLHDPVWHYLYSPLDAALHFRHQATTYGLVGHTHVPQVFFDTPSLPSQHLLPDGETLAFAARRCVINPGSVGQPRDSDPRAAYGLLDTETLRLEFHRVDYDIAATQAKIRSSGLPEYLAARLSYGH
jgi:diadenosine tetraphosphatase ApaH/serine/threonine PP2A family protein phosphatase